MKKDIKVFEDDWNYFTNLKNNYKLKSLADLMKLIKVHIEESIKKGDLEIFKNEQKK